MTNVDVAVSGSHYNLHGSPSLAHLIRDTAGAVPHPTLANKTLWDARLDEGPFKQEGTYPHNFGDSPVVMEQVQEKARVISEELPVVPLGSGSDYTGILFIFRPLQRSTNALKLCCSDLVWPVPTWALVTRPVTRPITIIAFMTLSYGRRSTQTPDSTGMYVVIKSRKRLLDGFAGCCRKAFRPYDSQTC